MGSVTSSDPHCDIVDHLFHLLEVVTYLCVVDHLSQEDPRHLFNNNLAIAEPEKRLCCTQAQVKTLQVILEMFQMTCVAPLV